MKYAERTDMANLRNKDYFPEDPHNMSYDEVLWFLYGIDSDNLNKESNGAD